MPRDTTPPLTARLMKGAERPTLLAPSVGVWRDGPDIGTLIRPGLEIGKLEILGVRYAVLAPSGAHGVVVERAEPGRIRAPVSYGDRLLELNPEVSGEVGAADARVAKTAEGGLLFRSPMSGRFYRKSAPDKPDFVEVGQVIETGHTVALLEVMKTFNRVVYGGDGLPARAKVARVIPEDGADLDLSDPILEVEPA